jgi:hypothetical protein
MKLHISIALVGVAAAAQAALIIDEFNDTSFFYFLSSSNPSFNRTDGGVGDFSAQRAMFATINPLSGSSLQTQIQSARGHLLVSSGQHTQSVLDLGYSFAARDFTSTQILQFHFLINNAATERFDVWLTDSNGFLASYSGIVPGSMTAFVHQVSFGQMTAAAGFDLTSIVGLNVGITTATSHGFTLSRIDAVPEPATMALAALGLAAAVRARRRRSAKA